MHGEQKMALRHRINLLHIFVLTLPFVTAYFSRGMAHPFEENPLSILIAYPENDGNPASVWWLGAPDVTARLIIENRGPHAMEFARFGAYADIAPVMRLSLRDSTGQSVPMETVPPTPLPSYKNVQLLPGERYEFGLNNSGVVQRFRPSHPSTYALDVSFSAKDVETGKWISITSGAGLSEESRLSKSFGDQSEGSTQP